jgi:hypothetical protein
MTNKEARRKAGFWFAWPDSTPVGAASRRELFLSDCDKNEKLAASRRSCGIYQPR